jgi:nucleoid-associated protein YgaU
MAVVVVQMGHVPRTSGRTGTWREQELTRKLGRALRAQLIEAGHKAHLMGADDALPVPKGDVFVALHGDSGNAAVAGHGKSTRRGASVGFPESDRSDRRLAMEWKRQHAKAGFPGGFLPDNNTANLREYYMWERTGAFTHRYLAEHATLTNSADEEWIFAHIQQSAAAHVRAIARIVGSAGGNGGPKPTEYVVKQGDTLIKIGKQFGLAFQVIATHNGIKEPFTIFPGQKLRIPR